MNLQPMGPNPFTASMNLFLVVCVRCSKSVQSNDVSCDLDAPAGTFYCQHCAVMMMGAERAP